MIFVWVMLFGKDTLKSFLHSIHQQFSDDLVEVGTVNSSELKLVFQNIFLSGKICEWTFLRLFYD